MQNNVRNIICPCRGLSRGEEKHLDRCHAELVEVLGEL